VDYWAVGGTATMIVFVFAAILKVVCEEFEELKPIALIIEKNKKEDDVMNYFIPWWSKKYL
jgi:hypothetical protein